MTRRRRNPGGIPTPVLLGGLAVAGYFGYQHFKQPSVPLCPEGMLCPPEGTPAGTHGSTTGPKLPDQLKGHLNDTMLNAFYAARQNNVQNLGDCSIWAGVMQQSVWPYTLPVWLDVCRQGHGWLVRNVGKRGEDIPEDTAEAWLNTALAKYGG